MNSSKPLHPSRLHEGSLLKLQNKFCKNRDNILFTMEMISIKNDVEVTIDILYCENQQRYLLKINSLAIKQDEDLKKYFQCPSELYYEIVENFDSVTFESEGIVRLEISLGRTRTRSLTLKGIKQIKIPPALETNVSQQMIEELKNLKSICENQGKEMVLLRSEVRQLKETKEEVQKQKLQITKLWECLMIQQQMRRNGLQGKVKKVTQLIPHPLHYDNNYCFKIVGVKNNGLTKSSTDKNWKNFIMEEPVKYGEIKKIKMRVQKSERGQFLIGVLQKALFNQQNIKNIEGIQFAFDLSSRLFVQPQHDSLIKQPFEFAVGKIVTLVMNRKDEFLQLYSQQSIQGKETKLHQMFLPVTVINIDLYFYIGICKPGQSVSLCQ